MSKYLPKEVTQTLINKNEILEEFKRTCDENKTKVDRDVDECLREVILVFEEYK